MYVLTMPSSDRVSHLALECAIQTCIVRVVSDAIANYTPQCAIHLADEKSEERHV